MLLALLQCCVLYFHLHSFVCLLLVTLQLKSASSSGVIHNSLQKTTSVEVYFLFSLVVVVVKRLWNVADTAALGINPQTHGDRKKLD